MSTMQPPYTEEKIFQSNEIENDLKDILTAGGEHRILQAEEKMIRLLNKGPHPDDICEALFEIIRVMEPQELRTHKILFMLGEFQYRMATGGLPEVQLRSFLRYMEVA